MWPKLFLLIAGFFLVIKDPSNSSVDFAPDSNVNNATDLSSNSDPKTDTAPPTLGNGSLNASDASLQNETKTETNSSITNSTNTQVDTSTSQGSSGDASSNSTVNKHTNTSTQVNTNISQGSSGNSSSQNTSNFNSNSDSSSSSDDKKEDDFLTVHLMLISHTDAGWIYTFEQYYQGTHTRDGGCVKCILNNVMEAFAKDPNRKYDMSEISFFNRWWSDQNETTRNTFKKYAQNNQFSFTNGAWVANDEAAAYYDDIMENFIQGHRWLKDNLDMDANTGWQVDSFGNSAGHAGLMAQAGFDALFFSRADYVDRDLRKQHQSLQYNWAPPNPHNESVFTQMLYLGYTDARYVLPQGSACRTVFCNGGLSESEYGKVESFVKQQAQSFKTKNVLLLVCDDFLFSDGAELFFQGAEAMKQYFNEHHPEKGIKVTFSHLDEYVSKVQKDMIANDLVNTIPVKHDDTYPYIEQAGHVWTGYFTSKPMYKMLVREFSAYYNAAKLFLTKTLLLNNENTVDKKAGYDKINAALNHLEQVLSIAQHHDSITGTMKNYVRQDYEKMITEAKSHAENVIQPIMAKYLNERLNETLTPVDFNYDWLYQDDHYDHVFNGETTPTFAVFNPRNARTFLIRVKIPQVGYAVLNESNNEISADLICHSDNATKDCFIYFTDEFPAYSTKTYKIIQSSESDKLTPTIIADNNVTLEIGERLTLKISKSLLDFDYKYCLDQDKCTSDSFHLDYYFYPSAGRSGAYLFTPSSQNKQVYSKVISGHVYRGKHITLVQIFRDNLRTDIKLIHSSPERGLEIDTYLDPVVGTGKEIVLSVQSKSVNNSNTVFYTDSNGYFMQKRVKNHKDDYSISINDGISINYYPMTSNMYIEDANSTQRLSLVTDRAQGASSLNSGEVEVMIHRVTTGDDWKGVNEALQEKDSKGQPIRVATRHFLSYSQPSVDINDQRRFQQYDLDRAPHLWFFTSESNKFKNGQNNADNGLFLPNLVKFFVRSYQPDEYIVRFNNLDDTDAKKVEIYNPSTRDCNLLNKFAGGQGYKVESVKELYWMTTKDKSEISRNILDPKSPNPMSEHNTDYAVIDLVPMEIRTFSIKIQLE